MSEKRQTEATIIDVKDDSSWKHSIEADIPGFDGDKTYRFLVWKKEQGPAPNVGDTGMAILESYQRSIFYVERGDISAGPVDGSESDYQVTWNMIGFTKTETDGADPTQPTTKGQHVAVRPSPGGSGAPGATFIPTPTPDERLSKELAKFRREIEGVNDRKAVTDILAMVEAGTYTIDGLIEDAEKLAAWYNARNAARCGTGMVQAAQEMGAVVTAVAESPSAPGAEADLPTSRAGLMEWVDGRGWTSEDIKRVLVREGYNQSTDYLNKPGNSVTGLAELLKAKLGW